MAETIRVNLIVSGLVQGVGFRVFIARTAIAKNLCGWIRNLQDGTVEIEAQGPAEIIDELLNLAKVGPHGANVTAVRKKEKTPDTCLEKFSVVADA
ncbi:MAG: acylphosphatase [Chlorobium sp.]|nr:MAG: acylphosphatase [Chlorobium sp.]